MANPDRPDLITELYNLSSVKGNLRGEAYAGYVRPTVSQFFTSKDFTKVELPLVGYTDSVITLGQSLNAIPGPFEDYHMSTYPATLAFDGIRSTYPGNTYYSEHGGHYIGYHFAEPRRISKYTIQICQYPNYAPKTWRFQGSNDGSEWVTLDTVTLATEADWNPVFRAHEIDNRQFYTQYRFVWDVGFSNGHIILTEIEMMEGIFSAATTASDNFDAEVIDTDRWSDDSFGGFVTSFDSGRVGGIAFNGQGLRLNHKAILTGDYSIQVHYDLTLAGPGYYAGLFAYKESEPGFNVTTFLRNNNGMYWSINNNASYGAVAGNPNSAWLRIRRIGSTGYVDVSVDGNSWVTRTAATSTDDITVRITSGANETGSITNWFDDFEVLEGTFTNAFIL